MEVQKNRGAFYPLYIHVLFLLFFASLFFTWRAVTSISIALILVSGLVYNWKTLKFPSRKDPFTFFIIGCSLYLLWQIVSLTFTTVGPQTWKDIQMKSGLLLLPLAIYFSGYVSQLHWKKLLQHYCLLLAAAMVYAFFHATVYYSWSGDGSIFYYYHLGGLIRQHPVYLSIYLFVGVIYLFEGLKNAGQLFKRPITGLLILLFTVSIFLLSSKLIISFYLLYLFVYLISLIKHRVMRRNVLVALLGTMLAASCIIFFTSNPVSNRFRDLIPKDISLLQQERFAPGNYFNGLEFRLLQWKLVPGILDEQKAWLGGTGTAQAQPLLDEQYLSRNMYAGNPETGERGYPGYNTHNQLLESLLKHGILGFLIFLIICYALIKMARSLGKRSAWFVFLLLLVYALVESVLETQYGILLFSFFPSFVYLGQRKPTFYTN